MTDRDREFTEAVHNDRIGTELVHETDKMRIWHIRLQPGERLAAHHHEYPYFWTALNDGVARSCNAAGEIFESDCSQGDTRYFADLSAENSLLHDLENIGDTELVFVTVEFRP